MKTASTDAIPTIAKYTAGGALAGGGLAALAALVKHFTILNQEKNPRVQDDDILYLNLGKRKEAAANADADTVNRRLPDSAMFKTNAPAAKTNAPTAKPNGVGIPFPLRPKVPTAKPNNADADTVNPRLPNSVMFNKGAALSGREALMSYLGAILAGYTGYAGVNKMYDNYRDKTLQKELDKSQEAYIGSLEGKKSARFGPMTRTSAIAQGVPMIVAIGAAIAANRMLDKQYPKPKPKNFKPRRIVIKGKEQGMEKQIPVSSEVSPDEVEGLARIALADEKRASASGINDVLKSIATGSGLELRQVVREHGLEAGFAFAKEASEKSGSVSVINKNLALGALCNDALLRNSFGAVIATEYLDMTPGISKAAHAIDPETQELIRGAASEFAKQARTRSFKALNDLPSIKQIQAGIDFQKKAMTEGLLDAITMLALRGPSNKNSGENNTDESDESVNTTGALSRSPSKTSDDPDVMGEDQKPYVDIHGDDANKFYDEHKDIIDSALALN